MDLGQQVSNSDIRREKIDELYQMRIGNYTDGLIDLITYINQFKDTKNMRMIEIGSYVGESTMIFANHFKEVISIDPFLNDYDMNDDACYHKDFNDVYKIFLENIKQYDNIKSIKKTSDDAIFDLLNETFDFIYIDGLHTYEQVSKDINNYKSLIKNNGFIGGHDYYHSWDGVIRAINENIGIPEQTFQDTSWIFKLD